MCRVAFRIILILVLISDVTGVTHQANSNGKVTELSSLVNKMLQVFEPVCASLKENWANIALQVHMYTNFWLNENC